MLQTGEFGLGFFGALVGLLKGFGGDFGWVENYAALGHGGLTSANSLFIRLQ